MQVVEMASCNRCVSPARVHQCLRLMRIGTTSVEECLLAELVEEMTLAYLLRGVVSRDDEPMAKGRACDDRRKGNFKV
jgi:hypothetical protein